MITIDDIRAQRGDSISAKWHLLEQFVVQQRAMHESMTGPGLLKDQSGEGFTYRAAPSSDALFEGALFVTLSNGQVTVAAGTIDGLTPTIDGVRCDGMDSKGQPGAIPKLKIEGEPNDELRSWICVEAVRQADSATAGQYAPIDTTDPDALIITHRADSTRNQELGTGNLTGILPLAIIVWSDQTTPSRVEQNIYFNQRTVIKNDKLEFDAAA